MGKLGPLTCQHRHNAESHPNCFYKEKQYLIPKVSDRNIWQWYHKENCRIGFFDIETSDLSADSGWMVSWALKERGNKPVKVDSITHEDIMSREFDKPLITRLLNEMRKFDVIVGYYSSAFDLPFTFSRSKYWNIPYFEREELHQIDLYFQLRAKLATSRKSLKVLTRFYGIDGKTELEFKYWKLASIGMKPELDELIEHNRQDVIILENLFDKFEDTCKFNKRSII